MGSHIWLWIQNWVLCQQFWSSIPTIHLRVRYSNDHILWCSPLHLHLWKKHFWRRQRKKKVSLNPFSQNSVLDVLTSKSWLQRHWPNFLLPPSPSSAFKLSEWLEKRGAAYVVRLMAGVIFTSLRVSLVLDIGCFVSLFATNYKTSHVFGVGGISVPATVYMWKKSTTIHVVNQVNYWTKMVRYSSHSGIPISRANPSVASGVSEKSTRPWRLKLWFATVVELVDATADSLIGGDKKLRGTFWQTNHRIL